jgi:ribosomal 50S subunit-recycling heat shock protein
MDWTVSERDTGVRLDKFLAAADRLGSRRRASVALDRGKVFINGVEAAAGAGSTRLGTGDRIRVWMDRPGSSRSRKSTPTRSSISS